MNLRRLLPYHRPGNIILYVCIGYYLLMCLVAPGFLSVNNTWNLLFNLLPLLIAATGQTLVMITAGIDLSVTSVIAVTSVVGGYMMSTDVGFGLSPTVAILSSILSMMIVGGLIGWLNGWTIAKLGMPAFMVTLTTMIFFSGFAIWLTESQSIYNLPEAFVDIPYNSVLGIPIPALIGMAVVFTAYLLLAHTLWGEWIYAVGLNPKAAKISGVGVSRTIILVYIISGICASVASVLYTARLETGSPVMGQNSLLDIIGAVVIGGTSLFGGKGKVQWTIYGVLFIVLLDNSLNLIGLSYFVIMIVKGAVILLAALLNVQKRKPLQTT